MKTLMRSMPFYIWNRVWAMSWFVGVTVFVIWFTKFGPLARGADFKVESKVAPRFSVTSNVTAAPADPTTPAPAGTRWVKRGNGPWKLEKLPAPAVAASTFRSGVSDGHQCPACGRSQYVVDHFNANGTHAHRCPADGTVWNH